MPRVTEMYAFVVADKNEDDEGIPAIHTREGPMPMVGADINRAESLKPYAQQAANAMGKSIRLVKFTTMTEVEVLYPVKP